VVDENIKRKFATKKQIEEALKHGIIYQGEVGVEFYVTDNRKKGFKLSKPVKTKLLKNEKEEIKINKKFK
jgi:tRNA threonylcarbamoyladenosine modification (KEOPS) complex Cgi121 subunit